MAENLSKQASQGLAWSLVAHLAVLALSVVTQLVLGWLLRDHDFGTYALAMAFCELFGSLKDGGIGLWLVRLSPSQFDRQAGPAFWLATMTAVVSALIVAVMAGPLAVAYGNSHIRTLMQVVSVTMPFTAYSTVAAARLQIQLRIPTYMGIRLATSLLRYVLAILFALSGYGALSFVLPLVFVVVCENALLFLATRMTPWVHPFRWHECINLFRQCRRTLWGTLASVAFRQTDYVVLGQFASAAVVGTYFFAYQLANQLMLLFGESLRKVTVPLFARVESDADRSARGLILAGIVQALFATPILVLLAATADPLEKLLWHGRWAAAVPAITLLAIAMPVNLMGFFVNLVAQARGRFEVWTLATLIRGLGFGLAVWLAAMFGCAENVTVVAAFVAGYIVLSGILETVLVLGCLNLPSWGLLKSVLPSHALAAGVVLAMHFLPDRTSWSPMFRLAVDVPLYAAVMSCSLWWLYPVECQLALRMWRRD